MITEHNTQESTIVYVNIVASGIIFVEIGSSHVKRGTRIVEKMRKYYTPVQEGNSLDWTIWVVVTQLYDSALQESAEKLEWHSVDRAAAGRKRAHPRGRRERASENGGIYLSLYFFLNFSTRPVVVTRRSSFV